MASCLPQSLITLLLLCGQAAAADHAPRRYLLQERDGPLEIDLAHSTNGFELELKGVSPEAHVTVFAMQAPSRLIVDVPIKISQQFREIRLASSDVVSLRFGLRKGMTRFIVELNSVGSPRFQLLPQNGDSGIRIRFAANGFVYEEVEYLKPEVKERAQPESLPEAGVTMPSAEERLENTVENGPKAPSERTPEAVEESFSEERPELEPAAQPIHFTESVFAISPQLVFLCSAALLMLAGVCYQRRRKYAPDPDLGTHTNSDQDLNRCFSELGLSSRASEHQVKLAYRQLAKQYHTDHLIAEGRNVVQIRDAEARFHKVQRAYERIKAARGIR